MLTDAIITTLLGWLEPLVNLIPEAPESNVPQLPASLLQTVADVNDLVPLEPVMAAALVLFGLIIPFSAWRLVVAVRHILLP